MDQGSGESQCNAPAILAAKVCHNIRRTFDSRSADLSIFFTFLEGYDNNRRFFSAFIAREALSRSWQIN